MATPGFKRPQSSRPPLLSSIWAQNIHSVYRRCRTHQSKTRARRSRRMLGTPSSCASFGSFDDLTVKSSSTIVKFLCSYGGRILPRFPEGKLRYVGGDTRVLAVHRSIPFSELQVKLGELCGLGSVSLRCQLPTEDLDDALVSVTSDEDLAYLYEEYDLASRERVLPSKIRAFLFPRPSKAPISSTPPSSRQPQSRLVPDRCVHHVPALSRFYGQHTRPHARPRPHQYLLHHGNHWQ